MTPAATATAVGAAVDSVRAGPSPLDALAGRIEQDQANDTPADPQAAADQAAQEAEAAKAFAAMMAGFGRFVTKALFAVRAGIAKKLPEIREHWTDDDLNTFGQAVPPVAQKWLGRLMPLIGNHPEEAALLMAATPLVVGYVNAASAHADAAGRTIEAAPAPAAAPAAATPAGPTPVFHVG